MMDCPPVSRIVDHNKDFYKTLKQLDKLIALIFEVILLACMFRMFSKLALSPPTCPILG